ncbi:MAG TPA: glycoside hydrolase family 3 N-terminal domain-containing protein [Ktedonobacterales bacterium]
MWSAYGRRAAGGRSSVRGGPSMHTALMGLLLSLLVVSACSPTTHGGHGGDRQPIVAGVPTGPVASPVPRLLGPDAEAALLVRNMSLDDKLGQMIVVQFTDTTYTPQQAAMVQPFHPGGVILYGYAMGTAQQVRDLLAGSQHDSLIPMFTFTDLEGGVVDRLAPYVGDHLSAPDMAASGNPVVARRTGGQVAHDMLSFGFNADLAPDVDVAVVMGPDQWGRTFGSTPAPVITYAGAWLQGLQQGGVVGCLKHFPGLGAATTDAHVDLPVINRSRQQFEASELAPYRALIASGNVYMVMSTDELVPALDPNMPAELSQPIITGILRDELHFGGVAITDALYMAGVADKWSFSQAAVLAIEAGNDMIMAPWQPAMVEGILAGLKQALAHGDLSMSQIDASVRRILTLKIRFHLLPAMASSNRGDGLDAATSLLADADLPR